jgi:hypothetical protein
MPKYYYDVVVWEGRYSYRAVSEFSTTVYMDTVVASFDNEADAIAEVDRLELEESI